MPRKINTIVIHCSATRPAQDVGVEDIRAWHMKPKAQGGLGARDIGYHYVIRRGGAVERGRNEATAGAHVAGHNADTIGVCLVGGVSAADFRKAEDNFTAGQKAALLTLCRELAARYPDAKFCGHRDFPGVKKACPSFDARAWARQNGLKV